jgi:hypothetical protein
MRRPLLLIALALAAAACGPVKNLDPLGGLGGEDASRYGFEGSVQGWGPASDGGSCSQVFVASGRSLFGNDSLAVALVQMGNHYPSSSGCPAPDNAGRAAIDLSGAPPDLSGKTVSAWVYLPSAAQASGDAPTQGQIYLLDAGDNYGNGPGVNLVPEQWTRVSFSPIAWAGPGAYSQDGLYLAAGFSPAGIKRLGVKISASGAAPCAFAFSGVVLVDAVTW